MSVTIHDPATQFVKSKATTQEYAEVLRSELANLPAHVPADKRVALAHMLTLERIVDDPIQRARARIARRNFDGQ